MRLLFILALFCASIFANTLDEIRQAGVIRVGVREGRPPLSESNNGKFEGFEIELASSIAKDIFGDKKGEVQFVAVTAGDRIPFLKNNKVDMVIGTFMITQERKKQVDFSLPYLSVNFGIVTRKEEQVKDFAQVRDMRISIEKNPNGSMTERYLSKEIFSNLVYCKNTSECYAMMKDGRADGYANDNIIVLAYAVVDDTLEVPFKNLGAAEFLGVGVQKGNQSLLDFINADLIKLSKEGFFKKAYEDTFEPFYRGTADKKYFLLDGIYNML